MKNILSRPFFVALCALASVAAPYGAWASTKLSSPVNYNPTVGAKIVEGTAPHNESYDLTVTSPAGTPALGSANYPVTVSFNVQVTATPDNDTVTPLGFVTISPSSLTFTGPGQQQAVTVTCNYPAGAAVGGYSYQITTSASPTDVSPWPAYVMVSGTQYPVSDPGTTIDMFVDPNPPAITSGLAANADTGTPFSYQITASNLPTSYSATGLPDGLTVDTQSGLISGTPTQHGMFNVTIGATNIKHDLSTQTGTATLVLTVNAAGATVTLGNLNAVYDGTSHAASVTTVPDGLAVSVTYTDSSGTSSTTPPTNAGSYGVVATVTDPGYSGSVNGTLVITAGVANVSFGSLSATYDGTPKVVTAATSPGGLSVVVTYNGVTTPPTNAGSYNVIATVNDPNYVGTSGETFVIAKAAANVALGNLNATYNGSPQAVTAAATTPSGGGLAVAVTYNGNSTVPTNAGSYTVVATVNDANYAGSATGTFTIAKASASVSLGKLNATYNGSPQAVTASATTPSGAGLAVAVTYNGNSTVPTSAGSYNVVATVTDSNYTGSANGTLVIAKATPVVTWPTPAAITTGTALSAAQLDATANVAGTFAYTPAAGFVPAIGAQTLSVTFTPTDTTDYAVVTTSVVLTVNSITATTFTIAPTSFTYTGAAQGPTITPSPAGATYTTSGTPSAIDAGSYTVTATANGTYTGTSGPVGWIIKQAIPIVTWATPAAIAKGTPLSAAQLNATANVPGTFSYTPAAGTVLGVGTQTLSVTFTPTDSKNYTTAGASVSLTVNDTTAATITLSNLEQAYDGTPKVVTAKTSPAGLAVDITYNGVPTPPTYPGSYVVYTKFHDPAHTGSATDTLDITITALIRHAPTLNDGDIDGSAQILLPENEALNSAMISGDLLLPGTPKVRLNGHPDYGSTIDGSGSASPSNYTVTLNGNAILRHVVRRIDPIAMPAVSPPPPPAGRTDVTLTSPKQRVADYTKLRNLTLNGNAGQVAVPPGTYGNFVANGDNGFVLGVAGATDAAVYNLQSLTLNGSSGVKIVGPIILTVANNVTANGGFGVASHPDWLLLQIANGGLTLNGSGTFHGYVTAPNGLVTINGDGILDGEVAADRLTINGDGLLTERTPNNGNCHDGSGHDNGDDDDGHDGSRGHGREPDR